MTETIIKLNPKYDQLRLLEATLRTVGKWADNGGLAKQSHFFIAKNPAVATAISLCFSEVTTFEKLREPISGKRCLVCEMYENSRKEQRDHAIEKAEGKLNRILLSSAKTEKE